MLTRYHYPLGKGRSPLTGYAFVADYGFGRR